MTGESRVYLPWSPRIPCFFHKVKPKISYQLFPFTVFSLNSVTWISIISCWHHACVWTETSLFSESPFLLRVGFLGFTPSWPELSRFAGLGWAASVSFPAMLPGQAAWDSVGPSGPCFWPRGPLEGWASLGGWDFWYLIPPESQVLAWDEEV